MTGYTPGQLPVLNGIAREFGVFDRLFCEVPSQTFVNHSVWMAVTSSGLVVNFLVMKLVHPERRGDDLRAARAARQDGRKPSLRLNTSAQPSGPRKRSPTDLNSVQEQGAESALAARALASAIAGVAGVPSAWAVSTPVDGSPSITLGSSRLPGAEEIDHIVSRRDSPEHRLRLWRPRGHWRRTGALGAPPATRAPGRVGTLARGHRR